MNYLVVKQNLAYLINLSNCSGLGFVAYLGESHCAMEITNK